MPDYERHWHFCFLLSLVETGSEDFSDFSSLHVPLFNSNKTIWAILFIMVYTPYNACLETHLDWRYLSPKRARVWDKTYGTHLGRLSYIAFVLLWIKIKSLGHVWQPYSNTKLHILNNITHIFTYFFIHMYIKNT